MKERARASNEGLGPNLGSVLTLMMSVLCSHVVREENGHTTATYSPLVGTLACVIWILAGGIK